jgi:hypothetical protein
MLEARGTPTVAIGLVRPQMEKTRPPRGLWTPFQLGRPLGEPEDPAFQRRVLLQALRLLERRDGPVILEDFPDDPPNSSDTAGWRPGELPIIETPDSAAGWQAALARELAELRPTWQRACKRYGRTTIGLSGQPPKDWPDCVARLLAGELPTVPLHNTAALTLRFLCDDIKAMYSEAAQADGPPPSSRQIDMWFWSQTTAGKLLVALRSVALQSGNNALRTVGGRFFVPTPYLGSPDDLFKTARQAEK